MNLRLEVIREALKFTSIVVNHRLGSWLEKVKVWTEEKLNVSTSATVLFAMMCV